MEEDGDNLILSLLLGVKNQSLQSGGGTSLKPLRTSREVPFVMTSCQGSTNLLSWVWVLPSAHRKETGGDSPKWFGSFPGLSLSW